MTPSRKKESFEQQLARLESIVQELEGGELDLEAGVGKYREGIELLKGLNRSLVQAEEQVEELTAELQQQLAEDDDEDGDD